MQDLSADSVIAWAYIPMVNALAPLLKAGVTRPASIGMIITTGNAVVAVDLNASHPQQRLLLKMGNLSKCLNFK